MSTPRTLREDLDLLHADYVERVNLAVAQDDIALAEQLASDYDLEATWLVARREGKTHLLPLRRTNRQDSSLRRLIRHLTAHRAA